MSSHSNPHTFDSALSTLKEGNRRFAASEAGHPHQDVELRSRLAAEGQAPLAAVLACSDSRAPVELLFDLGFGDLFIVRAAGQVAGPDQIGSIEYAVEHLGVPLVLVLGHSNCGAITAAVGRAEESGALGGLLARLAPVVDAVESLPESEKLPAAVDKAVDLVIEELRSKSYTLAKAEKEGRVHLAGAVYHLENGKVKFKE